MCRIEVGRGQLATSRVVMTWRPSRKHRRPVAELEDLVQPVADEEDRDAAVAQAADDREQALDLVGRERRRRLVEDQDARVDRERLGDLDELLVGHRQAADRRADVEPDVELLEQRLAPRAGSRPSRSVRSGPRGAWPMKTFSATVRSGNRRGSWWTTAMPERPGVRRAVDDRAARRRAGSCRCRAGGRRPGS